MKIVMVAPPWTKVPPAKYGGAELIVSNLTEELVQRGHQVALFASGDSQTKAELHFVTPKNLFDRKIPWDNRFFDFLQMGKAIEFAIQEKYDIIHDHLYDVGLVFSRISPVPIVHTTHGWPDPQKLSPGKKEIIEEYKDAFCAAIAGHQKNKIPLNYIAVVYNGIKIQDFTFNNQPKDQLIWLGRFVLKKGAHVAIEVAKRLGVHLILAGKIDDLVPADVEYFNTKIKPQLERGKIDYIGEIGPKERDKFMGSGRVFLNPVSWDEPFGLVVPEANACGTPVVAFARGAMPELIKDGVNGFLIKPDDIEGMIRAVKKIYEMSADDYRRLRLNCRRHVGEKFTVEKMVDGYERVYEKVIDDFKKRNKLKENRN